MITVEDVTIMVLPAGLLLLLLMMMLLLGIPDELDEELDGVDEDDSEALLDPPVDKLLSWRL